MCTDELSDWRNSQRTEADLADDLVALVAEGLLEAYVEESEDPLCDYPQLRFRLTAEGERCTTPALVELVEHAG